MVSYYLSLLIYKMEMMMIIILTTRITARITYVGVGKALEIVSGT